MSKTSTATAARKLLVGTYESIYLLGAERLGLRTDLGLSVQTAVNSTIAAVTSGDTNGDGHREISSPQDPSSSSSTALHGAS